MNPEVDKLVDLLNGSGELARLMIKSNPSLILDLTNEEMQYLYWNTIVSTRLDKIPEDIDTIDYVDIWSDKNVRMGVLSLLGSLDKNE